MVLDRMMHGDSRAVPYFKRLLWLWVGLWWLVPLCINYTLPLDVLEGMAWGKEWQWGYDKHPPLPAWLVHVAFEWGRETGVYALAAATLGASALMVYGALRCITGQARFSSVATLLLAGVYYYSWPIPEFNHNTLQMVLWPACLWCFYFALQRPVYCLGLALLCAALLYTKYTGALLIVLMLAYAARYHGRLYRSFWFYAAAGLCVALCIPHLIWLQQNNWAPIVYAMQRSRDGWPWSFACAQVLNHLPMLLLMPFVPRVAAISATTKPFIRFFALAPVLCTIALACITQQAPRDMWGAPMFSFSGALLLLYRSSAAGCWSRFFAVAVSGVIMLVPVVYGTLSYTGHLKRVSMRSYVISQQIQEQWRQHTRCPLTIVAGDVGIAGAIASQLQPRPSVWIDRDIKKSPWVIAEKAHAQGYVLMHNLQKVEIFAPLVPCQ